MLSFNLFEYRSHAYYKTFHKSERKPFGRNLQWGRIVRDCTMSIKSMGEVTTGTDESLLSSNPGVGTFDICVTDKVILTACAGEQSL